MQTLSSAPDPAVSRGVRARDAPGLGRAVPIRHHEYAIAELRL